MTHLILIRAAYAQDFDPARNARRLSLTRSITARALEGQTCKQFRLLVRIHPGDPLLSERMAIFNLIGVPCHFCTDGQWQEVSASVATGAIAQTRLDDDDAIATTFVELLQAGIREHDTQQWFSFPRGVAIYRNLYRQHVQVGNQFITRVTQAGDGTSVFDVVHGRVGKWQHLRCCTLKQDGPMWFWLRHCDAYSMGGFQHRYSYGLHRLHERFSVDWNEVMKASRSGPARWRAAPAPVNAAEPAPALPAKSV